MSDLIDGFYWMRDGTLTCDAWVPVLVTSELRGGKQFIQMIGDTELYDIPDDAEFSALKY